MSGDKEYLGAGKWAQRAIAVGSEQDNDTPGDKAYLGNGKWAQRVMLDGGVADGSVTTDKIADGAVTTVKLATGSVTDDKLATPKIDKPDPLIPSVVIGTTLSTNELGLVGYSQSPMADQLVMYQFGGQVAAADPQADGDATTKRYVDGQVSGIPNVNTLLSGVDPIADPANATAEDIANKINEILTALKQ